MENVSPPACRTSSLTGKKRKNYNSKDLFETYSE
jgi:hypothetical protein